MFDHVTIRVADREASERFYTALLENDNPYSGEHFAEWGNFSLAAATAHSARFGTPSNRPSPPSTSNFPCDHFVSIFVLKMAKVRTTEVKIEEAKNRRILRRNGGNEAKSTDMQKWLGRILSPVRLPVPPPPHES